VRLSVVRNTADNSGLCRKNMIAIIIDLLKDHDQANAETHFYDNMPMTNLF